jgi:tRNA threonylcarbamoyladenosine biosynthesis protein TsaE
MKHWTYRAATEQGTAQLGAALAAVLPDGTTVSLNGTLGAGKTRLVRAVAAACGIANEQVVSPTYVLCQEYHGRRTIYHMDVYRIADDDEFLNLGPEEYFESSGIIFVEWAEKVVACLPDERIEIVVEVTSETSREFHFTAIGHQYEEVLNRLAASCSESK